jgi:hypothetical protein
MAEEKPTSFIYRDIPRTTAEAVQHTAFDESLVLVKSAIQAYLEKFFSKDGEFRPLVESVSPTISQFVTDLRLPLPGDYPDPTKYRIQIARMWQGLKQRLPCIIISETGWDRQSSLTDIAGGLSLPSTEDGGPQHAPLWLSNFLMGSVDVLVGSQDEHTTGQIASQLINIFGPLKEYTKSTILGPQSLTGGSTWEVRLPMTYSIGARERINIGDDPVDSIWAATITMDNVHFEGLTAITTVAPVPYSPDVSPNEPADRPDFPDTEIVVQSPVKLGRVQPFRVVNERYNAVIYSDDPRIALIRDKMIIPKKTGTFNIVVANGNQAGLEPTVYATQQVEVTII